MIFALKAPARSKAVSKPRSSPYTRGKGARRKGGATGGANPSRKGGRVPNRYGAYVPAPKVAPLRSPALLRGARSAWFVAGVVLLILAELAINELFKRREKHKDNAKRLLTQNHRKVIEGEGLEPVDVFKVLKFGEVVQRSVTTRITYDSNPGSVWEFTTVTGIYTGPGDFTGVERVRPSAGGNVSPEGTVTNLNGYTFQWLPAGGMYPENVFIGSINQTTPSSPGYVGITSNKTISARIVGGGVSKPYPMDFGDLSDSAPSAYGEPASMFEPNTPTRPVAVSPAALPRPLAAAGAPVQPAPAPAPGDLQPGPLVELPNSAVVVAPVPKAPKVPANAESMGPNAALLPAAAPPPPPTPPGSTFLPGGVELPNNGPRPTPDGTASELGKLERKLELALAPDGPLSLLDKINQAIDQIENIKFVLENLFPPDPYEYEEGEYYITDVCNVRPENGHYPYLTSYWNGGQGELNEVKAKIDALAVLINLHKELKQPVCRGPAPTGQGVTVTFEEVQS